MESPHKTSENLQPENSKRDGLFHVTLPGIKKDPLWITYMEDATQKAAQIMEEGSGSSEVITNSERNVSILTRRLMKSHGINRDDLHQAVQFILQDFVSNPTLKDISDYVIADAHYNYSLNDPLYKTTDSGARVTSNYGTPRELEPAFNTPFRGVYEVNPYQGYIERAQICKREYSDANGYMRAPLAKLVLDPAKGYVYELADQGIEKLKLTQTSDNSWWPTDIKYFDAIWNHINGLYTNLSELAKSDHSIDTKALLISQIGWWFFQVMPYTRGNGGIGNALLQSLYDFSSIKNSPYKEGLSPDLEALVTPLPIYAENFSDFFIKKFEKSRSS